MRVGDHSPVFGQHPLENSENFLPPLAIPWGSAEMEESVRKFQLPDPGTSFEVCPSLGRFQYLTLLGRCLLHNVQLTVHTQVSFAGSSPLECLLNTNILDVLAFLSSCLFLFMLHTYKPLKLWSADDLPALIFSWSLPNQPVCNVTHPPCLLTRTGSSTPVSFLSEQNHHLPTARLRNRRDIFFSSLPCLSTSNLLSDPVGFLYECSFVKTAWNWNAASSSVT